MFTLKSQENPFLVKRLQSCGMTAHLKAGTMRLTCP